MKAKLYIDNVDVFDVYGIYLIGDYAKDICQLPKIKDIEYNDWHEKNGIDPDLSVISLAAKSLDLKFACCGGYEIYSAFISMLSNGAYHTFSFATLGRNVELRLVKCGDVKSISGLTTFNLKFSEDKPLNGYVYTAPESYLNEYGDYFIDDIDVAKYGIRILDGTYASIVKQPDVKENLSRNIKTISGLIYDSSRVVYKSKTVTLKCLIKTTTTESLWKNIDALLYNLIRPDARVLYVESINKAIPFYYKESKVDCALFDEFGAWVKMDIVVEFFNGVI